MTATPALQRGTRKALRDLLQAVAAIAAAGGTTALIDVITGSVAPGTGVILAFAFKVFFAFIQNWAETSGRIPTLLPSPSLVIGTAADAVATVDAVADRGGEITGPVLDVAGDVVGSITGQLDEEKEE